MLAVRTALALAAIALTTSAARAAPQWNTALVPSGCLLGTGSEVFERVGFCGSVRGDVLFLRENARDFGLGPYLSVGTAAFDDFRASLGLSALLPVLEDFPLVLSAGPLLRDGRELGVSGTAFWGLRSYNHYGSYNIAVGLALGAERTFGDRETNAISIGLHVDGFILAIPPLLLFGALK